jgi:hypothetical protein
MGRLTGYRCLERPISDIDGTCYLLATAQDRLTVCMFIRTCNLQHIPASILFLLFP